MDRWTPGCHAVQRIGPPPASGSGRPKLSQAQRRRSNALMNFFSVSRGTSPIAVTQ